MQYSIIPSIWFDSNSDEAMKFYTSVFDNSSITQSNSVVTRALLSGVPFLAINGRGVDLKPNTSISFMVICETKEEIDAIWKKLLAKGKVYMALDNYPWSQHYGWIADQYGFTWQLYLGKLEDVNNQKMVPTLMFSNTQQGKCEQAVRFYESVFKDFQSQGMKHYERGDFNGQVMHTQFTINGFLMMAMDSGVPQDFTFNEAVSMTITCKDQVEIDYYWNQLTKDGEEGQCGWCKDSFGVSWQVVPQDIDQMLFEAPNAKQAFEAMMKMNKININGLKNA